MQAEDFLADDDSRERGRQTNDQLTGFRFRGAAGERAEIADGTTHGAGVLDQRDERSSNEERRPRPGEPIGKSATIRDQK